MKKLIFDNSLVRIYDEGHKDLWNKKVFRRYLIVNNEEIDLLSCKENTVGVFVYKTNNKDRISTMKRLGKNVGTSMFIDCPTANVKL